MNIEFDINNSERNKEKHTIDFIEAQKLWEDPHLIEMKGIASSD